ncbi:MAG TPA: AzlD domain-containing protein [Burkholderiaceae bacterium]|nr:AzlD domain-containing protein [Burkholderiaceae bacterium]
MATAYVLGAVLLLSLCSFLTRCVYLMLGHKVPLPDKVRRPLRYAPMAALVAIIVPELMPFDEGIRALVDPRALAGIIAILVFAKTRSAMGLIAGGMVAFWVLRFLFNVGF